MAFFGVRIAVAAMSVLAITSTYAASREPVDLGRLASSVGDQAISVTITLKLRDLAGAEDMMRRVSTPTDPMYLRFMRPAEFLAQFGPTEDTVAGVIASLRHRGLTVEQTTPTTLRATGSSTVIEQTFQTSLHQFQQPATDKAPAFTFHAPTTRPVMPAEIAPSAGAVVGLSTKPVFHSNMRQAPNNRGSTRVQWSAVAGISNMPAASPGPITGTPGSFTVLDTAARYNVNPLYQKGIKGRGRTIGIVTFASFTPSDAFAYWNSLNLPVDPNRLTVVNIDGGPGAPSDASESGETTLDVEQSGGLAPDAKIIVYQGPNTFQTAVDAFAVAVHSNKADTISTSFGGWEGRSNDVLATGAVTDPFSGKVVTAAQAEHEFFVQAALQGQSLFADSGDAGAFQVVTDIEFGELGNGTFTVPLSVVYPAADTAITAAGGTTLPVIITFVGLPSGPLTITVPTERVWGEDYLMPLCNALQLDPVTCGIFPSGGGGGVSVFERVPFYQLTTAGVQTSQPGQVLSEVSTTPPQTLFTFPANFRGRNLPDVSLNADPLTGFTVFYTSDVTGFAVLHGVGGTSFVAPQLAGMTALLAQNTGRRLGLLNPLLYWLASAGGTKGPNAVLNTISTGDNWFYSGRDGYSPAAGLGTLNVENLAKRIKQLVPPGLLVSQNETQN